MNKIEKRGKLIKDRRKAKGWKQHHLASKLGVSRSSVSQWETGETEAISAEYVYKLSILLDISISDLLIDGDLQAASDKDALAVVIQGVKEGLGGEVPADTESALISALITLYGDTRNVSSFKAAVARLKDYLKV